MQASRNARATLGDARSPARLLRFVASSAIVAAAASVGACGDGGATPSAPKWPPTAATPTPSARVCDVCGGAIDAGREIKAEAELDGRGVVATTCSRGCALRFKNAPGPFVKK
jgi:hypothetical protein